MEHQVPCQATSRQVPGAERSRCPQGRPRAAFRPAVTWRDAALWTDPPRQSAERARKASGPPARAVDRRPPPRYCAARRGAAPGTSGPSERGCGADTTRPTPHLARHAAVVGAALPEPPAVAADAPHHLLLVGEVHLPDEGAVAEHPHGRNPQRCPDCGRDGAGRACALRAGRGGSSVPPPPAPPGCGAVPQRAVTARGAVPCEVSIPAVPVCDLLCPRLCLLLLVLSCTALQRSAPTRWTVGLTRAEQRGRITSSPCWPRSVSRTPLAFLASRHAAGSWPGCQSQGAWTVGASGPVL